jgi:hypothetical protein
MKLISLLQELLLHPTDQERLDSRGENLVDSLEVGPYKIALLRNNYSGRLQMGLTSHENLFTNPEDQQDRPSKESTKTIMALWGTLTNKIKEWGLRYGEIHGGSMNNRKTIKYRNIFMRYGLKCGEIYKISNSTGFVIYPINK